MCLLMKRTAPTARNGALGAGVATLILLTGVVRVGPIGPHGDAGLGAVGVAAAVGLALAWRCQFAFTAIVFTTIGLRR